MITSSSLSFVESLHYVKPVPFGSANAIRVMSLGGGASPCTAHGIREATISFASSPDEQSTMEDAGNALQRHHETVIRNKKRIQAGKARAARAISAPISE